MPSLLYSGGQVIQGITSGLLQAVPFLDSLAEKGLPANEMLRQASALGYKIQRTAGLAYIRQAKKIISTRPYVSSLKKSSLPNPDRIPFAKYQTRRAYSYNVPYSTVDNETGEIKYTAVTVSTDNIISKQQAQDIASQFISKYENKYNTTFKDFGTITITKSNVFAPE